MSVMAAFSVTPLGAGEHVGAAVAAAVRVVRQSGLPNRTDAMFTIIEGETLSEVNAVIERAVEAVARLAPRVSVVVKLDCFAGRDNGLDTKVAAVEAHLTAAETGVPLPAGTTDGDAQPPGSSIAPVPG
jgi:uncharacterized protein YqgV (UPF0045/DUF77 family)